MAKVGRPKKEGLESQCHSIKMDVETLRLLKIYGAYKRYSYNDSLKELLKKELGSKSIAVDLTEIF